MTEKPQYVCVLQSQGAEQRAIRDLHPTVRKVITPLFELHHRKKNFPTKENPDPPKYAKTLEKHITDTVWQVARHELGKSDGAITPFFWDVPFIDSAERCGEDNDVHPVSLLFDTCHAANLPAIPVITLERDTNFRQAVAAVIARDRRGVVVRIKPNRFHEVMTTRALPALLRDLGVTPAEVDLIIDLESVSVTQSNARAAEVMEFLDATVIRRHVWRSLTVASGAFPKSLAGVKQGVSRIPRTDYAIWWNVFSQLRGKRQTLNYADYAIQAPKLDAANINPRFLTMSANLRYATPPDWAVVRGGIISGPEGAKRRDFEFRRATRKLVGLKDYRGPLFSAGDFEFKRCAMGRRSSGGTAEVWRQHGTSHHIVVVWEQLDRAAG